MRAPRERAGLSLRPAGLFEYQVARRHVDLQRVSSAQCPRLPGACRARG